MLMDVNSHILCTMFQTDDKGVFSTSLSEEYALAAQSFSLSKKELWNMSFQAINYVFEDEVTKEELRKLWMSDCVVDM